MDKPVTSETYARIDPAKIYPDMSVSTCMDRYQEERDGIIANIRAGNVSASMSGIEYYPKDAPDLDPDQDSFVIETALSFNGQVHVDRPDWRQEFLEWKAARGYTSD